MLSRIAEALYWMGRYLERADDTARLLDVYVHRMVVQRQRRAASGPRCSPPWAWTGELARIGESDGPIDLWRATELLAYDADNPSSVVGLAPPGPGERPGPARDPRHRGVGGAQPHLPRARQPRPGRPRPRARTCSSSGCGTGSPSSAGSSTRSLLHDDGWRFLTIGRCLERVDMTARLLGAVADSGRRVALERRARVVRGQRRLPAHLRRRHRPGPGAGHAAAGPGLPPVGQLRPRPRPSSASTRSTAVHGRPAADARRAPHQRRGPRGRPHPQRARLHRARRPGRRPADATVARLQAACAHASELVDPALLPPGRRSIEWNVDRPA